jgi:hypothetical protein
MKFRVPSVLALLALALTACQAQEPPAEAQAEAPVDAAVATAVSDVRAAAIDPATGKARDAGAIFVAGAGDAAPAAPDITLGDVAPGAPSPTLDITPDIIVPGDTQAGN